MDSLIELIRFLFATAALVAWGAGQGVQLVLRVSGRRSERLARFLASTKEQNLNYWIALAMIVGLVLVAWALKTAFDRSPWVGWVTLGLLIVASVTVLWLFTRKRFLRVLFGILGFVAGFADFIFIIVIGVDHGAPIAVGVLILEIVVALGIALIVSRSAFRTLLAVLGFLLFLAAPVLVVVGVALLDEYVGRSVSLLVLGLSLVATAVAAPYFWWRDPDPAPDADPLWYIIGYVVASAIVLGSTAFVMSPAIGWGAIGLTLASASLATLLAVHWRRTPSRETEA
jgi:hypothetical protein